MSRNFRNILLVILVVVLVGAGIYFLTRRQQAAAEQQFEILREAEVARDRIASTVNATGSIEPESLVTLTFGLGADARVTALDLTWPSGRQQTQRDVNVNQTLQVQE